LKTVRSNYLKQSNLLITYLHFWKYNSSQILVLYNTV